MSTTERQNPQTTSEGREKSKVKCNPHTSSSFAVLPLKPTEQTRSQGRQGRKDLQGAEERYTLNKYLEIIENTYVGQCRDYGEEISKKGQLESHMPLKPGTTYRPTRFEELGAICR